MSTSAKSEKDRVVIFDTTLRDGEQCPGATMTHDEKLEVAELLDDMGVDIIEAGFPIASNGDFEAVSEVAKRSKNSVIAGLARAIPADIERAGAAIGKPAGGIIDLRAGDTKVCQDPVYRGDSKTSQHRRQGREVRMEKLK